jgi:hypothetical protein
MRKIGSESCEMDRLSTGCQEAGQKNVSAGGKTLA